MKLVDYIRVNFIALLQSLHKACVYIVLIEQRGVDMNMLRFKLYYY